MELLYTCDYCKEKKIYAEMKLRGIRSKRVVCLECYPIYLKEWNAANKEARTKSMKKWRAKNKKRVHDSVWRNAIKRKYGIDENKYNEMLKEQGGVCKICKKKSEKRLAVDHDHKSGKVRGLLCSYCNTALGSIRDDKEIAQRMIDYLG